jgi:uncharacterized protein (DUF4415 family)
MNGKLKDSKRTWVDSDDAPEITEEWIEEADLYNGEKLVRRGRGPQQTPTKQAVSIRLSPEVLDYFRATGKGWQTRLDEVLKGYVREQR